MERLFNRRKIKEAKTLQKLLIKSFVVLELVLQNKQDLNIPDYVSSLETSLLSTERMSMASNVITVTEDIPGKGNINKEERNTRVLISFWKSGREGRADVHLIAIIASYIHFTTQPSRLPLLATRVLTLLCEYSPEKGVPGARPPSIVGYYGPYAETIRNAYITRLNNSLTNEVTALHTPNEKFN